MNRRTLLPSTRGLGMGLTLATAAFAQQGVVFDGTDLRAIDWQGTGVADVTRGVTTDVDGDGYLDAFYLDGSSVFGCLNPAYHTGKQPRYTAGVADVTATPDGTLITVGSRLNRLIYDPLLPHVPNPTTLDHFTAEAVEATPSAAWDNATRVIAVEAGGTTGLVGLSTQNGVHSVLFRANLGPTHPTLSVPIGGPVLDLVPYHDGAAVNVMALSATALYIIEPLGTPQVTVTNLPVTLSEVYLTTFNDTSSTSERVAALMRMSGTDTYMLHSWDSVGGLEPVVYLNGSGAHGIAAADLDDDGNDDLIVSVRDASTSGDELGVRVYENVCDEPSASTTFDNAARTDSEFGLGVAAGATQRAVPMLGAFARDGEEDLVVFLNSEEQLLLAFNQTSDHRTAAATIPNKGTAEFGDHGAGEFFLEDTGDRVLHGDFNVETDNLNGATHIEITFWRGHFDDGTTPTYFSVRPEGVGTQEVALVPDSSPGLSSAQSTATFTVELSNAWDDIRDVLVFEISPITRDTGGALLNAGPLSSYCVTWNEDTLDDVEDVLQLSSLTLVKVFPTHDIIDSNGNPLRSKIGGTQPLNPPPPSDDDEDDPPPFSGTNP